MLELSVPKTVVFETWAVACLEFQTCRRMNIWEAGAFSLQHNPRKLRESPIMRGGAPTSHPIGDFARPIGDFGLSWLDPCRPPVRHDVVAGLLRFPAARLVL